jgi:hypothetical protein
VHDTQFSRIMGGDKEAADEKGKKKKSGNPAFPPST